MTAKIFCFPGVQLPDNPEAIDSLPELSDSISNLGITSQKAMDFAQRLTKITEKIYTIYSNNQEAVGFDPAFSLLYVTALANMATDELMKLGLCSAVNKNLFETCRHTAIKNLQEVEYIETFDEDFDITGED